MLSDDDYLFYVFGSRGPEIADLPHLVTRCGPPSFDLVLAITGDAAGLWGHDPIYYPDEFDVAAHVNSSDCFSLWELAPNQEYVQKYGGLGKLGQFNFVLPLSTPMTVLKAIEHALPENTSPGIDNLWHPLLSLLPKVRWFYSRFDDETPLAVFCAADAKLVDELETRLDATNVPHTKVVRREDGRETWDLGNELRELCGLKYGPSEELVPYVPPEPVPLSPADEETRVALAKVTENFDWSESSWYLVILTNESLIAIGNILASSDNDVIITAEGDVTDDGLLNMPLIRSLVSITVSYPVTVSGLQQLARQPALRRLVMVGVYLNSKSLGGIDYFRKFQSLKTLEIDGAELSEAEIDTLSKETPTESLYVDGVLIKGTEQA